MARNWTYATATRRFAHIICEELNNRLPLTETEPVIHPEDILDDPANSPYLQGLTAADLIEILRTAVVREALDRSAE